jgi:maltodextrin utilization protein YvdJ
MGLFNQSPSPTEEAFYQRVLEEVESGQMRKGIYAKALADSSGNLGKANSLYIKYRVQSLMDEHKALGYSLPSKRAQKRIDKKQKEEEDWANTPWYEKTFYTILGFALIGGVIIVVTAILSQNGII